MDLLDIIYHLSHSHFTADEENKLYEIVKQQNKEYLFKQSFSDVKNEILDLAKEQTTIVKTENWS